ncbi:N-acetyl-beta-glucosaminyl-glycoprotein 4-beta-N-acetylgalactosaminyltransferase 1 [Trichoplax sp. H2]|nr:N-acetyl-beta-glucosaminyl-glycoprotein 4-beta-N-acetylgalactosaminyltransferase 1 [Trichoplax sp. H2]|eukprot:RDD45567.1 N-acetyl-beta-glucosaminyl-glycoprotein 4-beta-N-acetylgalactosaminyltransferase 1 [Trichoplax sp. H2]
MTKISKSKLVILLSIGILYLIVLYTREFNRAQDLISMPYCQCHEGNVQEVNTRGNLCLYRWESSDNCLNHIGDLRKLSTFPHNPTVCQAIDQFQSQFDGGSHGQRIFGYIHPEVTSYYQFAIVADDGAELWLSHDTNPDNAKKIAQVDYRLFQSKQNKQQHQQISNFIRLDSRRKYWIEALHTRATGRGFIKVGWKMSRTDPSNTYHTISRRSISLPSNYIKISRHHSPTVNSTSPRTPTIAIKSLEQLAKFNQSFHLLPRLNRRYLDEALKFCSYGRPSYVVPPERSVNVVNIMYYLSTIQHQIYGRFNPVASKNDVSNSIHEFEKEEAYRIVESLLNHINKKNKGKFELVHVHGVEQKSDRARGSRYLVDIIIKEKFRKPLYRISEYLYKYRSTDKICNLVDLQWNNKVHVYIVIMIANENINAFRFFLRQLERYYNHTHDDQFTLMVVGSSKASVQLQTQLYDSSLKRYQFVEISLERLLYARRSALNTVLSSIRNGNSIILQYDNLHLNFPLDLMENVRKRCFPGKMAYMPISFRFQCGAKDQNLSGYWQGHHFNLAAYYLSDYKKLNQSEKADRFHLQGEDAQLAIKLLMKQLEIERLHYPGLYQFNDQQITLLKKQLLF